MPTMLPKHFTVIKAARGGKVSAPEQQMQLAEGEVFIVPERRETEIWDGARKEWRTYYFQDETEVVGPLCFSPLEFSCGEIHGDQSFSAIWVFALLVGTFGAVAVGHMSGVLLAVAYAVSVAVVAGSIVTLCIKAANFWAKNGAPRWHRIYR